MYRFFLKEEQLREEHICITGSDYNHIKNVLRMKPGEEVLVSCSGDKEYLCEIAAFSAETDSVLLKIVDIFGSARELPAKVTLFQGYPKGDKLETIVQKAVELGAFEVVPVMMKRCVVKLDDKKASKKVERLNNISLSAAKQSKRGIVPEVLSVMSLEDAVEYAKTMDYVILAYENAEGMEYSRKIFNQAAQTGKIGIFIGPEGGFEASEVKKIEEIGGRIVSLGHRILRTETAGIAVLSVLMYLMEQ
jgi:16S rRNA (uracil1498-N3)-methyltransferase